MKRTVILQLLVLFAASTAMAQGNKNFREDFEAFKKGAKQEYSDFRKKALAEYAEYVRQAWKEYGAEPPREMPQVKEVEPMLVPDADEKTESWFSKIFGKRKNADKDKDKKAKDKKPAARQPLQDNALKYTKVIEPAPLVEQIGRAHV